MICNFCSSSSLTNVCTSVFADSSFSDDRTRRSWHSWNSHVHDSEVMWSAILSWLSTRTPRSETAVENLTLVDSKSSSVIDSLSSCCSVPSQISWVLSVFILNWLLLIPSRHRPALRTKRSAEQWSMPTWRERWCTLEYHRRTSGRLGRNTRWHHVFEAINGCHHQPVLLCCTKTSWCLDKQTRLGLSYTKPINNGLTLLLLGIPFQFTLMLYGPALWFVFDWHGLLNE